MATLLWRMLVCLMGLRISASYRLQTCSIYPIMGTIINASTIPYLSLDCPEGLVVNGHPIIQINVLAEFGFFQLITTTEPTLVNHALIPYLIFLRLNNGTDAGTVSSSVHNETDDPILAAISYDFRCFGATSFNASWANIVTWNDMPTLENETQRVNYQIVVATDGVTSWTRWSYGVLEYSSDIVEILLYSSTLPEIFTIDPYHQSANARDIALDSNVGCPGCWYFEMTQEYANAVPSPCDCRCVHGTCGDPCMLQPCTCESGWTGDLCDQDMNECDGDHGCHEFLEECVNVDGSFTCEPRGCALCNNAPGMYCEKHGFCFEVGTVLSSEACVKRCECKQNKKQTKTKWKCGKVKDQNVCNSATLVETCGLLNCLESDHKKFCGKRVPSCVGTDGNFNVLALFKRKDHKSVMNTCT